MPGMTMDHHAEVLAMNLWMGVFGVTAISDAWTKFAAANSAEADAYRDQARQMIGAAHPEPGKPARPGHHHSLGWLFGA